jgi:PilZ domain
MEDRRKNPRFEVASPLQLTAGTTTTSGRLRDICKDAALVDVERPRSLGEFVTLAIDLPGTGEGPVTVAGQVIRVAPGEGGGHGAAVLFTDVTPQAAARINFFLELQSGGVG